MIGTGDTTVTRSGSLSRAGISLPVPRGRRTGNQRHLTTGICIKSAILSKTCSRNTKTGDGAPSDMINALIHSCPLPTSKQASSPTSTNVS
ncbi:hypothetical protein CIW82_09590 [Acetobacter tropicalis]|uniref:Uncharacterized protein n=1 Tax=Acetobacter tropicalis TaxID=104102 RepID=A0A291PMB1_9PROT|nr:hypothetical protein CIW82_09590 [Acetobacter tropicalis]